MIGIYDSGVGGFSVLYELRKVAPNADVIYFGDTINAPYGNKSKDEVIKLTYQGIKTLIENGATEIISACNSVSVSLVLPMFDLLKLSPDNIIEMVGPTVEEFANNNYGKTLLLATNVTIESSLYQNAFSLINKTIETKSIPELAGLIEVQAGQRDIKEVITEAFKQINLDEIDTIILGCTHYPLVKDLFIESLRDLNKLKINLYDPAKPVAIKAYDKYTIKGSGKTDFIFSKTTPTSKHYQNLT